MIVKTLPIIYKMYKQIYEEIIKREKRILNKCESIIEGNMQIKEMDTYANKVIEIPENAKGNIEYLKRKLGVK